MKVCKCICTCTYKYELYLYSTVPVDGPNSSVCIVGRDSAKNSDNSPLLVILDRPYDSRLADTPLDDDTVYDTIKYAYTGVAVGASEG